MKTLIARFGLFAMLLLFAIGRPAQADGWERLHEVMIPIGIFSPFAGFSIVFTGVAAANVASNLCGGNPEPCSSMAPLDTLATASWVTGVVGLGLVMLSLCTQRDEIIPVAKWGAIVSVLTSQALAWPANIIAWANYKKIQSLEGNYTMDWGLGGQPAPSTAVLGTTVANAFFQVIPLIGYGIYRLVEWRHKHEQDLAAPLIVSYGF